MKIGIIVIVLVLGVMFAGQLMILPAQNSTGSATSQTQPPNDTSEGKASTQVPPDPVNQQTQSPSDTMDREAPNGIHFDPTIRLDMSLSILIARLVFVFGSKTRSKSPRN